MILAPEGESKFMQRASVYLSVSIIRTRSKQLLNTSHVAGRSLPAFHMHHVILAMTLCLGYDYVTDGKLWFSEFSYLVKVIWSLSSRTWVWIQTVWIQLHILNQRALLRPKQPPLVRSALSAAPQDSSFLRTKRLHVMAALSWIQGRFQMRDEGQCWWSLECSRFVLRAFYAMG